MFEPNNQEQEVQLNSEDVQPTEAVGSDADYTGSGGDDVKVNKPRKRKNLENEKLRADLKDLNDQLLRNRAEFENYRRRTEKEKLSSVSNGIARAVEALLPALDILITAAGADCSDAEYKKGIELIGSKFMSSMQALGITEIPAEGKPFDPTLHNAVSKEEAESVESDTIVRVLQKGYRLGDRVIRHATVTVAQ